MGPVELGLDGDLRAERDEAAEQVEDAGSAARPIASSTVGPKIARKSMLPKMCRKLACRNIDVNTVSQVAGCGPGLPTTPG